MTANTKEGGGVDNTRGSRTTQSARPNPKTGHHSTYHPRHSIGPQGKRQGGRQHTDGDVDIRRGVSNAAALHSPCHPPSAMPPHHPRWPHPPPRQGGGADRGYPTTQTPQTHTHTPHTRQGTVHDMTAILASTAMGRAGHEPHHRTGQDSNSTPPPPFHTPRRMDTIHSSTHPLIHSNSFMFTQPTNDHGQRTTNDCSMIDQ